VATSPSPWERASEGNEDVAAAFADRDTRLLDDSTGGRTDRMRTPSIAIAVSGLGRIRRGSETWATDLAEALHQQGAPVHLYAAGPVATSVPTTRLPTLSRTSVFLQFLSPRHRYLIEQRLFTRALLRQLRTHRPDVIHLTDPQVAWWTREALRNSGPPVFYMDGLLLGPDWNWRFDHVQVLAPEYLDAASRAGRETRGWRVIPHFVDPAQFQPASNRQAERARILGSVPPAAHLALAVGDFAPGSSKRLHYIVEEFARIPAGIRPHLLLVGNATVAEHRSLEEFSRRLLGHGVHIRTSLPRSEMAAVYRCADVFVHAALREPFGIVLLEAMASGLPVIGHDFPVTRWIIGEGGTAQNLEQTGRLAETTSRILVEPTLLQELSAAARRRVLENFSAAAVLPSYLASYEAIGQAKV